MRDRSPLPYKRESPIDIRTGEGGGTSTLKVTRARLSFCIMYSTATGHKRFFSCSPRSLRRSRTHSIARPRLVCSWLGTFVIFLFRARGTNCGECLRNELVLVALEIFMTHHGDIDPFISTTLDCVGKTNLIHRAELSRRRFDCKTRDDDREKRMCARAAHYAGLLYLDNSFTVFHRAAIARRLAVSRYKRKRRFQRPLLVPVVQRVSSRLPIRVGYYLDLLTSTHMILANKTT